MTAAALVEVAAAGDRGRVLELLGGMDDAARQAARRPLSVVQRGLDAGAPRELRDCVTLAVLGCVTAPSEAAKALISLWRGQRGASQWAGPQLEAFAGRDCGWLADVGRRVAAAVPVRRPADWPFSGHANGELYRLARGLVWMAGAEPPVDDGFALEWALTKWRRHRERTLDDIVRTNPRSGEEESAAAALRADPYTSLLLPRVFGLVGFGTFLEHPWHWRADLIAVTLTGELDRAMLIERCVDGLIRGGRPIEPRGFWALLDDVAPTEDELAAHAPDWAALAGRADAPVAGRAVEMLRRLLDAGRLDTGLLAEASHAALSRPEKTLVRTHLKLVAEALRRAPQCAAELLPPVTAAFGHQDSAVQQQAWKLAARHLATIEPTVRAQLTEALPLLTPDLRDVAAAALGEQAPAPGLEPQLPPVSAPHPTSAAPHSVSEAVQEIAALLAARTPVPTDRERAVDALIRAAYRDRAALAEVLAPVTRRRDWIPAGLAELLRAVLGEVTVDDVPAAPPDMAGRFDHKRCIPCLYEYLLEARWYEAARRLLTEPVPFLLATPGWSSGALDADVLVQRLTEYARLGLRAGPADLDQALLRTRVPQTPERQRLCAAAAALGTADGTRLAHWLDTAGSGPGLPSLGDDFTPAFRNLDQRLDATWHHSTEFPDASLAEWIAVAPVFREYLADGLAHWLDHPDSLYEYFPDLPLLVEADGPAGRRLTAVLACAVARSERAHRTAVAEALLQATVRGDLDEPWCGELLGRWTTWRDEPYDFAPVLAEAARAGAYRMVWNVLSVALPALLARPRRPRTLGGVLMLAADCAAQIGATGDLPGLDELADSKAGSQAVKQARRLRSTLTAGMAGPG
ncbi:DUF6493 family protein [Actinoplanes awajinensis]|uniref:DUF6493 family protein n=1 Tax=Actinoplanes awajinensis TaxID=135946 RepID=UPI000A71FD04|nr:DUF6493 family protein [Actinoplanes awajinensis]